MKSKFLLLFCSLFIGQLAFSQVSRSARKKYIKKYEQFFEKDTKLMYIGYCQTIEKAGGNYIHKTYNPDKTVLTHLKSSSDRAGKNLNGKYAEWYDNGNKWLEGRCEDNKRTGIWKEYDYSNSEIKSGKYIHGSKEGKWTIKDSLNRMKYENNYENGVLNGASPHYDTTGQIKFIFTYLNDSLVHTEILDSIFYATKYRIVDEFPVLKVCYNLEVEERKKCSDVALLRYIYSNIEYPMFARRQEIEGTAIISFTIEKDGSISSLIAHRGICEEIEAECFRIIKNTPEWSPGLINGEPVSIAFNLPVRFRLE